MTQKFARDEFDVYVWEGTSDIASRAERCLAGMDVSLVRADAGTAFPPPRDPTRPAVALVSVSVMGDNRFSGYDWLAVQALPVIWVAAESRGRDSRYYPPEYSYTLPLAFTTADLRKLLFELLGTLDQFNRTAPKREQPLIAVSEPMRALLAEAEMFADCRSNALIHGETGVGKERIARLLHDRAEWSDGPFVAVNCGAIPEGLFEAHFFGHAKGAFTGAVGAHKGYFEQANGGTLFLDEIGDMPLPLQTRLLRVLAQGEFFRVGGRELIRVDVRVVAATHQDLEGLVAQGRFRADLLHRLDAVRLQLPPLRERREDIAQLASTFLAAAARKLDTPPKRLTAAALQALREHDWPGNVRELENVCWRMAALAAADTIGVADVDTALNRARGRRSSTNAADPGQWEALLAEWTRRQLAEGVEGLHAQVRERVDHALLEAALQITHGRRAEAAARLGLGRNTLTRKIKELGMNVDGADDEGDD
ncbi:hypothetical protein G6F68_010187 [Rhizopus microsporus]|nr:hypothetical protein G6F68_010187 [Rhizopus microsporus]